MYTGRRPIPDTRSPELFGAKQPLARLCLGGSPGASGNDFTTTETSRGMNSRVSIEGYVVWGAGPYGTVDGANPVPHLVPLPNGMLIVAKID